MKFFKKSKGFLAGFLCCALLCAGFAYADGVLSNIAVEWNTMKIWMGAEELNIENLLYDGRTYVPLRSIAEWFDKSVQFDSATNEIHIEDKSTVQMMSKEVAFLVNGQPVRVNYFTQMINWYKLNSGIKDLVGEQKDSFKEFVKGEVIGIYVTQQYCDDLRITLNAADRQMIDDKIAVFAENYGGMEAFQAELAASGVTYEVYYSLQEYYALRSKLLDVMTDQVSEDTLRWYYEDHIKDFQSEKVLAKHILLRTTDDDGYPLSDSIKQQKRDTMNLILDEITRGEKTFDEAMFEYSEDPGLKINPDGYWVARGEFTKTFENTAFSLQPGEMSDVFESEVGYHILTVLERKVVAEPFDKVKDNIYNTIRNDRYFIVMNPKIEKADVILNTNVYNNI